MTETIIPQNGEIVSPKIYSLRKGADKPPADAVYVGRDNPRRTDCPANPWFNPFHIVGEYTRDWVCGEFESYAAERLEREPDWLRPLVGKSLVCWCAPLRCHAETLFRLANDGRYAEVGK